MKPIKILCDIPYPGDSTSFYRAEGPLVHLEKQGLIQIMFPQHRVWSDIARADIFFMQRPGAQFSLDRLEMAHDVNVPVWVDYDDDLLSVEPDSMYYEKWKKDKVGEIVSKIVKKADRVTLSTHALYKAYNNKFAHVIPNALNEQLFPPDKRQLPSDRKVILWRGSSFHAASLLEKAKDIVELMHEHPDWKWVFMGYLPWFISENAPKANVYFIPSTDVMEYHKVLQGMKPTINMVTLRDTLFNHSKSMCSWLETTYAGACCIAPNMGEWIRPGITNYRNNFKAELKNLILAPQTYRTNLANQSWEYIKNEMLLKQINNLRYDSLKTML